MKTTRLEDVLFEFMEELTPDHPGIVNLFNGSQVIQRLKNEGFEIIEAEELEELKEKAWMYDDLCK